jgi:hypothetical protein
MALSIGSRRLYENEEEALSLSSLGGPWWRADVALAQTKKANIVLDSPEVATYNCLGPVA